MKILKMLSFIKFINNQSHKFNRSYSSALYITGDKAYKTFALLTPVIDFEKQLKNRVALETNFKARELPLDVNKIEERWIFFCHIDNQRKTLEFTRVEIGRYITELLKDEENNKDEIEKYKLHSKLVKNDLKNVKDYLYSLEENIMLQLLDLPNILHEKTGVKSIIFHKYLENNIEISSSHMEIGAKLIEYKNPLICFFKSKAALFEIGILNYFRHSLLDLIYTQFSNPDFCRSVTVEGCGINYKDKKKVFLLEHDNESEDINRLHLCGGATLYSFMSYFCRHNVQPTCFPLKYFSVGKKYQPVNNNSPRNLFELSQESVINIFTVTSEEDDILDDVTKNIITIYERLGYHFRLVYLSAKELNMSESLRVSIQMFSNHLQDYVEVGNISVYDSYLSQRLLFNYTVNKERKYPKIIAGSVVSIPKLLGCVLENNSIKNEDLISPIIEKYMFL